MAGTKNDTLIGKNADFSQAGGPNATSSDANGLNTNGQLWIGSTALNAGGTHINVGTLTSPNATISISYSSPNITLQAAGTVATTYTGNSGIASAVANNLNILGATVAAGTSPLVTSATGNTVTINAQRSQALAAADSTKVGLSNFNSVDFTVDANGFVSLSGTNLTINVQRFTSTGAFTYTPTANTRFAIVELQAGGGGSGGTANTTNQIAIAGGGSGGGYAKFLLTAAQIGASLSGSVGVGGTAGAAGNNAGGNGGNTTLATTAAWTCTGGTGGAGGAASGTTTTINTVAGGGVTTGTGTIIETITGGSAGGAGGSALTFIVASSGGSSGLGIGCPTYVQPSSQVSAGISGTGFGSGAAGSMNYGNNAGLGGAVGQPGIAIFTEFIFV